jgi:hypothetical protein
MQGLSERVGQVGHLAWASSSKWPEAQWMSKFQKYLGDEIIFLKRKFL